MSESAITIRLATMHDAERIVGFLRAMAIETEDKHLDGELLSIGVADALRDPSHRTYYLAERAGTVVGQTMVTTEWSDWRGGYFWWIQSVYVEPSSRRLGVFRMLYDHIRGLARERDDICGLRLYVHRTNARAIEAYRNLGMTVTEYRVCEETW